MTTRNQKKREAAKKKTSSSKPDGVDFVKEPIVALPAMNPSSDLIAGTDGQMKSVGKQADLMNVSSSSPAVATSAAPVQPAPVVSGAAPQVAASPERIHSSPVPPVTPATVAVASSPANVAAAAPVITTTSNPVLRDIFALKAGELKVVSPAVSKYFGFPAGPVEKLDFNDPKVADFFSSSEIRQPAAAVDTIPVMGCSVQATREGTAALVPVSGPVPTQSSMAATVSPSAATAPLIPQPSVAVSGMRMNDGAAAGPPLAAVNTNPISHTTPPTSSWSGLFKNNRALNDDTKMNPNFVGVTSDDVEWNDDDLEDDVEEKRSLIGFFNGKFPGIDAIQHIVDDWPRKCSFYLHNSGWIVFTFDEEADSDFVLKEGPYYAFNKPLVLKKMPEYFDFSDDAYSTAPVWIQLPNLPLRAWKKPALEKICTFLGTPLHIDKVTKDKTRKSFARCLVEIDVSKDLPNIVCCKFPSGKVLRQHVLYEEMPTFCTNCKKLGHETDDCYAKTNGMPSLYVARSKRDREKKGGNNEGKARAPKGAAKGPGKQTGHGHFPKAATTSLGANGVASRKVAVGNVGAGSMDGRLQQVTSPKPPVLNNNKAIEANKNGKEIEARTKVPGFVSTNSFGPLANGKVGSWAEDAETSNAWNQNNSKKTNGKKN